MLKRFDTFERLMIGVIVAAVVAVILLTVAAVSDVYRHRAGPHSGRVVSKNHRGAYVWLQWIPAGKAMVPIFHHEPERWSVTILNAGRENSFGVSSGDFQSIKVGDYIQFEGDDFAGATPAEAER